mgnify:CR=1 FL=1
MKKRSLNHYTGLHARCIELLEAGKTQKDMVAALGVSQSTISRWLSSWQERGQASLTPLKAAGNQPLLDRCHYAALSAILQQGALAYGFAGDFWTYERVGAVIEKEFGVSYKKRSVGNLLQRLNFSLQKPIKKHYAQNAEQVEEWRTTRLRAIKKKPAKKGM